jgi:hypothetical protein
VVSEGELSGVSVADLPVIGAKCGPLADHRHRESDPTVIQD